jgi:hypothetical protein
MPLKPIMHEGPFGGPLAANVRALVAACAEGDALTPGSDPTAIGGADIDVAVAEGLGAPLGARLAAGKVRVPPARHDRLLWEHQGCVADNLMRRHAIESLAAVSVPRGIPLVLMKGMALVQSTFQLGERSMADVDLLVPPSRWHEACAMVLEIGFRPADAPGRSYTASHDYVRSFTTAEGMAFEIHRFFCEETMFSVPYEGDDGIFSRAQEVSPGLWVPEAADLFLSLAAHAAKHTFDLPLRSFLDGIVLLRRSRISIDALRSRARAWRMERTFHAWMQCLAWLTDGGDGWSEGWSRAGSLRGRSGRLVWSHTAHASPWQRFLRLAWLMDDWTQWSRHVARRVGFRMRDVISARQ